MASGVLDCLSDGALRKHRQDLTIEPCLEAPQDLHRPMPPHPLLLLGRDPLDLPLDPGHWKATRCYAWAHRYGEGDQEKRHVTVLGLSPIDSAVAAVQAAIVDEYRNR